MVSMKMSKKEAKEMTAPIADNAPEYPYDLRISLNSESLEKLGIEELPKVGSKMMLVAMVEVTSVSSSTQQDGDENRSCDLQITDLAFKEQKKSRAESIYG